MTNQNLSLIGQNIRRRRVALGLTQEQLGFAANINRGNLANIELGKKNPSLLILCEISRALDCNMATLVEGLPVQSDERPEDE